MALTIQVLLEVSGVIPAAMIGGTAMISDVAHEPPLVSEHVGVLAAVHSTAFNSTATRESARSSM